MDSFDVTIDALVKNDEIPNFNQVEKISEIKVSGSTSLDAKYKENDGLSRPSSTGGKSQSSQPAGSS